MAGDIGIIAVIVAVGYLLGSIPTAYLIVIRTTGKNIQEIGSGNVGTLNVHRATGSKVLTLATLVGDVLKGTLALLVGSTLAWAIDFDPYVGAATGGILAVVGHNYPVFLSFRGGKGIATALPVLYFFEPILVGLWLGTFLLTVATTRILVLGQILGTVLVPIACYFLFPDEIIPVGILAIVVFVKHAPRIPAIVKGTEPSFYYKIDHSQDV